MKIAQHLVFWNQAKIIYPISLKQVYVLNKDCEIEKPEYALKFNAKFIHLKISYTRVRF